MVSDWRTAMMFVTKKLGVSALMVATLMVAAVLLANPARGQETNADLSITKEGPETVEPGETFNYVLTVSNAEGAATAETVVVRDVLPPGVEFEEADPEICVSDLDAGFDGREEVTCTLANLGSGESVTITLTVRAFQPGEITNRATADDPTDEVSAVRSNPVTTGVVPRIVIDKLDDPDPVTDPGDLLLYTIRVQNQSQVPVRGVAVTDDLPLSQVDFVTLDSNDFDCQITAGVVQCNDADDFLGPGEIARVEIVVEPEVSGTIVNRADAFVRGIRGPIATDIEETLVLERAVPDEDGDGDDGGGADNGDDGDDNGNNGSDNGDPDAGENQYDDGVIVESIPNKPLAVTGGLPSTGGTPGIFGAAGALLLVGAGFLLFLMGARRRS